MNKLAIVLFLLLTIESVKAQSPKWSKLGCAEKVWVILHPFSARKAARLTQETLMVVDSIQPSLREKYNGSGSRLDAFRHAYWMSLLSARIGPKRALWLGRAHEKKNKKDFEQKKLEDGSQVDKLAIDMDLANNKFGAKLGKYCKTCSDKKLMVSVLEALKVGELTIIRHNSEGVFLDTENNTIQPEEWQGKFINKRNLVPSNFRL